MRSPLSLKSSARSRRMRKPAAVSVTGTAEAWVRAVMNLPGSPRNIKVSWPTNSTARTGREISPVASGSKSSARIPRVHGVPSAKEDADAEAEAETETYLLRSIIQP